MLGSTITTMDQLNQGTTELSFDKHKVLVEKFEVSPTVCFLQYVFGGCEINLNIAIDFTLSNGDPLDPKVESLHNSDPEKNEYIKAIRTCGEIL